MPEGQSPAHQPPSWLQSPQGTHGPERPPGRTLGAERGPGPAGKRRATSRPADRVPAPHQDKYGHLRRLHLMACGRRAAHGPGRGLRGRHLLCPSSTWCAKAKRRRDRHHHPGLATACPAPCRGRGSARRAAGGAGVRGARGAGALRRPLRHARAVAEVGIITSSTMPTRPSVASRRQRHRHHSRGSTHTSISTPIARPAATDAGCACAADDLSREQLVEIDRQGGAARLRRRRLPDRREMEVRAGRTGAAPDGGQCRRRRARHLQGPLISSRPDPHRVLEGMLIGVRISSRRRRSISICATNIRPAARSSAREIARLEAAAAAGGRAGPSAAAARGAYICGEESAMIESHRGQARPAAPPPAAALSRSASSAGRR